MLFEVRLYKDSFPFYYKFLRYCAMYAAIILNLKSNGMEMDFVKGVIKI